jgi:hypothetical protein
MANRSVFTPENGYRVDTFPTLYSLPPEKYADAETLQKLMTNQIKQMMK